MMDVLLRRGKKTLSKARVRIVRGGDVFDGNDNVHGRFRFQLISDLSLRFKSEMFSSQGGNRTVVKLSEIQSVESITNLLCSTIWAMRSHVLLTNNFEHFNSDVCPMIPSTFFCSSLPRRLADNCSIIATTACCWHEYHKNPGGVMQWWLRGVHHWTPYSASHVCQL